MTVMEYIKKSEHLCKTLDTSLSSYFAPTTQSTPNKSKPQCQICGKLGHKANICYHRTNLNYQPTQHPPKYFIFFFPPKIETTNPPMLNMMSSNIAIANSVADNIWYLDLRATHHFIPDYSKLTSATPFTRSDQVSVGDGKKISLIHKLLIIH